MSFLTVLSGLSWSTTWPNLASWCLPSKIRSSPLRWSWILVHSSGRDSLPAQWVKTKTLEIPEKKTGLVSPMFSYVFLLEMAKITWWCSTLRETAGSSSSLAFWMSALALIKRCTSASRPSRAAQISAVAPLRSTHPEQRMENSTMVQSVSRWLKCGIMWYNMV